MGLRLLKNKSWQLIELSHQISVPLELEAASLKTPSVSAGAQLPSWEETGVSVSEGNWVLTGHSRTIWKTAQTVYNSVPEKSPVQLWLSDSCGNQGTNLQAICFGEQLVNRIEKKKKWSLLLSGPRWACFLVGNLCNSQLYSQDPAEFLGQCKFLYHFPLSW